MVMIVVLGDSDRAGAGAGEQDEGGKEGLAQGHDGEGMHGACRCLIVDLAR